MNIDELRNELIRHRFKKHGYRLNVKPSSLFEGHCIEQVDEQWLVYYFERGQKFEIETFDSESIACERILNRIKSDPFMK